MQAREVKEFQKSITNSSEKRNSGHSNSDSEIDKPNTTTERTSSGSTLKYTLGNIFNKKEKHKKTDKKNNENNDELLKVIKYLSNQKDIYIKIFIRKL